MKPRWLVGWLAGRWRALPQGRPLWIGFLFLSDASGATILLYVTSVERARGCEFLKWSKRDADDRPQVHNCDRLPGGLLGTGSGKRQIGRLVAPSLRATKQAKVKF